MRRNLITAIYLCAFCCGPAAAQASAAGLRKAALEASQNKAALDAAYKSLDRAHMSYPERVVVIRHVGRFVVVSVMSSAHNVRGGRVHVVYDPVQAKVVYTLGEQ